MESPFSFSFFVVHFSSFLFLVSVSGEKAKEKYFSVSFIIIFFLKSFYYLSCSFPPVIDVNIFDDSHYS